MLYSGPDAPLHGAGAPVQLGVMRIPADNLRLSDGAVVYHIGFVGWFIVAGSCYQGGGVAQGAD